MAAGTRLAIGSAIVLGATAYMAYVGASASWRYYLSVDECLQLASELSDRRVRISGDILAHSLSIPSDRRLAEFQLAGTQGHLRVSYFGPIPDNLAEARQVVVEGHLLSLRHLQADTLLTRCASKYTSAVTTVDAGLPEPGKPE